MENIRKALKSCFGMSDGSIDALFARSVMLKLPKKHTLPSSVLADKNFYFIKDSRGRGKRVIQSAPNTPSP